MLEPSLVTKIPFKQDSNYYYKHGLQKDNIHMDIYQCYNTTIFSIASFKIGYT